MSKKKGIFPIKTVWNRLKVGDRIRCASTNGKFVSNYKITEITDEIMHFNNGDLTTRQSVDEGIIQITKI